MPFSATRRAAPCRVNSIIPYAGLCIKNPQTPFRLWAKIVWRSRRDSNPRAPEGKRISSAPRYDRFDTTPDCSRGSLQPLFYSKTSRRILQDFPAFFPRAFSKSRTKAFSKALSRPFPMRFTAFCPPAFCGNSAEILREVQP